jgi:hypothetical protein
MMAGWSDAALSDLAAAGMMIVLLVACHRSPYHDPG